jgi:uncharacterized tellurite resistance protein B-like protein
MSLASRLIASLSASLGGSGRSEPPDERLASAALLVHVARVDGALAPAERERLTGLFQDRFGLDRGSAEGFVARATALDDETRDIAGLVDMIGRDADEAERRRLLAMAYGVATADGRLHEFEDDLVWRVGRLLGFDDAAIGAQREHALRAVPEMRERSA